MTHDEILNRIGELQRQATELKRQFEIDYGKIMEEISRLANAFEKPASGSPNAGRRISNCP
ncbi:MAG: hypothetical protein R3C18_27995 [Planctomycetaceae bacterium]